MLKVIFFIGIFLYLSPVRAEHQLQEPVLQEPVVASCSERTYAYMHNNAIHGISYEVVKAVFERANVPFQYRILPWARIYHYGLHKENFLVACLGKTPEREGHFQWVGAVNNKLDINFYGLASNPVKINSLEEMKKYTIGVLRGSYYEDFLTRNHFPSKSIYAVSSTEQVLLMLNGHRFDFFLLEESTMSIIANSLKISPDKYKKALFAFHAEDYLAFSQQTSPELVKRVRKAYQELAAEGKIQEIFAQEDLLKGEHSSVQ
ncbi:transporter substrate-binding domain-containing protein [Vibrio mangrovi]|nr:transporter substrate-binding domain-containing protein [Vibrio mangrovi]MDW6003644.1 transporter substrate-binding domain-containing protein [Vibrio mangrovi]